MSKKKKTGKKSRSSSPRIEKSQPPPDFSVIDRRMIERKMRQLISDKLAPDEMVEMTSSSLGKAQEIIYDAFETESPRKRIALARQAIEVSADCADAYVLLAEHADSLPEALAFYEQGVAAGERALGEDAFEDYEGDFWGFLESRPYMRAREGLIGCLWAANRQQEAIEHCRIMLRLNPNDNQGIRYRLASMLLDIELHDELADLLDDYEDDDMADWVYTRALLAFRQEGDSERARRLLADAHEINEYVPAFLTGVAPMPIETPPHFTWGDESEAVCYASQHLPAWKNTSGAVSWLRKTLKVSLPTPPKKKARPWSQVRSLLADLPQDENDVWEIDLRGIALPADDDNPEEKKWVLVVTSATQRQLLSLELFDERPKDRDVLDHLASVMHEPEVDEPHRSAEVRVARKAWFNAWKSKLKQIGITCRLSESLEHIDYVLEEQVPLREMLGRRSAGMPPSDNDWPEVAELPQQVGEIWQADVRRLATWTQVDGQPQRPWITMVTDVSSEAILATEITDQEPADDWLWQGVCKAMCRPSLGDPHRPGVIQVASDEQQKLLAEHLEPDGIRCVVSDRLACVDRLISELMEHLSGQQRPSALIRSPGVTSEHVGDFFAAAADFYRHRPWRQVPSDTIFQIACDQIESGPWYAVVMGQSGMELGLALYEDLELVRTLMSGDFSDEECARRSSAIAVVYGEMFVMAPADLEAAEQHDWPVAGPEAYPSVMRVNPGMALRGPLKWEIELLACCLRAIPEFVSLETDNGQITVPTPDGTSTMQLTWLDRAKTNV